MPKIIENLRSDIINGASKIIEEEGIDKLNIRRLSAELGIAASTVYNYYENKEAIVGAVAMVMWNKTLESVDELCDSDLNVLQILSAITVQLRTLYKPLFLFHVTSLTNSSNKLGNPGHQENYKNIINNRLKSKIETLLIDRGHEKNEAGSVAEVLSGLIIVCMHSDDLDMEKIASAISVIL